MGSADDLCIRDTAGVMLHCRLDILQVFDDPVKLWSFVAQGYRQWRPRPFLVPGPFQLEQRDVIHAPLRAGEERPFQGILQAGILRAVPPPPKFRAGAADTRPLNDLLRPRAVSSALTDQPVHPAPVLLREWLCPAVQVLQDHPQPPGHARILDGLIVWKRFQHPLLDFYFSGIFRKPVPGRASGRNHVRNHHVVESNIVQAARRQVAGVQVGVHVE